MAVDAAQSGNEKIAKLKAALVTPQKQSIAEDIVNQAKQGYDIDAYVIPTGVMQSMGMNEHVYRSYEGRSMHGDEMKEKLRRMSDETDDERVKRALREAMRSI